MPSHSLKGRDNIQAVLKTGKRFASPRLVISYRPHQSMPPHDYRVAFLIPRHFGSAVERNRMKRWMREDFRKLQTENGLAGALVVRLKNRDNPDGILSHRDIFEEMTQIYKNILKNVSEK